MGAGKPSKAAAALGVVDLRCCSTRRALICSREAYMCMQPKPQTSPFSQPSAFSDASDEPLSLGSLGKKGHSAQPAPRLQYRQGSHPSLSDLGCGYSNL